MPKSNTYNSKFSKKKVKVKLCKGDHVIVITGSEKKKHGKVLNLNSGSVVVEGINHKVNAFKADMQSNQPGKLEKIEAPIDISNVAIFNPATNKADSVAYKVVDGKKTRVYKSSGEPIQVAKAE